MFTKLRMVYLCVRSGVCEKYLKGLLGVFWKQGSSMFGVDWDSLGEEKKNVVQIGHL